MIQYFSQNHATILTALVQHIWLALLPVAIGVVFALPLGYLAVRYPRLHQPIVNTGSVIYSIPSLALFVVLPAILGAGGALDPLNVVVALSLYSLALLTRTVADALTSVQGETTQAAFAMGYRPLRRLFGVELPMALPVLFAGLRVATVANISLVSVGADRRGRRPRCAVHPRLPARLRRADRRSASCSRCCWRSSCDLGLVLLQRAMTPWTRAGAR